MPRAGLTTTVVTATAAAMVDRRPDGSLTLAGLAAELGVKPPSLYNHIGGLEDVERLVAIDGIGRLGDSCRTAVMGRSGVDGLRSMARAYRSFAVAHPGVYPLTQVARPGDAEYASASARALEPVAAILAGFGLESDEIIHAARAVRSALHGFAMLESGSGFGLDVGVDESFEWVLVMIESLLAR